MKKLLIASVSAVALMGLAACSDSTDNTTTQSVPQSDPAQAEPSQVTPAPPATDDTTTQGIAPAPETGSGGEMPSSPPEQPLQ